jgi:mannose/fructose/N-acetylgalactosamine-specific phosphotransferase system component IID/mannose/fructose/N-acetylgalactosamine-specific phosphotransferase system component IIC
MELWQAITLGGLYWLSYCGFGCHSLNLLVLQPLPLSVLVGLVMGDMPTAVIVGATIQPMYLSQTQAGWVITNDTSAAGIITAAVAITSGMGIESAMAVAVAVGLVMSQLTNVRMTAGSIWNQLTDKYIAQKKYGKIWLSTIIFPSLFKVILYWIPMSAALYFGSESLGLFITGLPNWLQSGLSVVGSMMPIVGMCIVASAIGKKGYFPFFIAGFLIVAFTGLSSIGVALLAVFIAFFDFWCRNNGGTSGVDFAGIMKQQADGNITKGQLNWAAIRLWLFYTAGNSYERYQANGVVATMFPILKKLYKDKDAQMQDAMQRTSELFNAEDMTAALPIGIALSMEEQKSLGAPIDGDLISETKAALFPPMAALGDTVNWATIVPVTLAIMCPYALSGAWWPGIAAVVIAGILCNSQVFFLMHAGYRMGSRAVKHLIKTGMIEKILSMFTVLGMFVIGGMTSTLVHIKTPIEIAAGDTSINLQTDVLDALIPNLLTFTATMIIYKLLKSGKVSVIRIILGIVVVGLALGILGVLA